MWGYLRASGYENWLAGLTFGSKRLQGWNYVGLFAGEWLRKWVGRVSVWALACAELEF